MVQTLAIAGLLAAGLAVPLLIVLARRRRTLRQVEHGLRALAAGRSARSVAGRHQGRLGRVVAAFNEEAPRLADRLRTLEGDRQLLEGVFGGMSEGVMAVDDRRRLLFANHAAGLLLGIGDGDVGRLVAEAIREPRVQRAVEATLRDARPFRDEFTVERRPEGTARGRGRAVVLAVHGARRDGAAGPAAVLVFRDVTELRHLERMRQDFVANASHELKTPLASIRAYTETLLDGAVDDPEVNLTFLRRIDEQADRLNRLVLDLLSLARLEAGGERTEHAPLAVVPVVERIVDGHQARARTRDQALSFQVVGPPDRVVIRGDEEALRQVLDNLIDNALKYTPERGRITVRVRAGDAAVVLEVADTGIGIPPGDLPRIFERFYRVDTARSRALGGTGLGLAIVKHQVQRLGGQIHVESRVNAGTLFRVSLPARAAADAPGGGPPPGEENPAVPS